MLVMRLLYSSFLSNSVSGFAQEFFPHIFGPEENQPLDAEAACAALADLAREVNASVTKGQREKSVDEVRAASKSMCSTWWMHGTGTAP